MSPRVAVFVLTAGLAGAAAASEPVPAAARTYPLAAQSLVLDADVAGKDVIAVGDRGFILRSKDSGATWTQQASPVQVMLTAVHMADAMHGWAVGHDAVILQTADGGATWTVKYQDPDLEAPLFDIWFENAMHGIAVGAYGLILETTDGGATWNERRISEDEPHLYTITATADGALFSVGEIGSVFKSTDKGATWTELKTPYDGTFFGALALKDGSLLVHGLRGNVFRTENGGESWVPVPTGVETSLLGAVQRTSGAVVLTGLSGTLLTSADGRNFATTILPDRQALGGAVEAADGKLLVFGEKGAHPFEVAR
jgi:photosystem II stability/assembly factor-like uncharacterized protein